MRRLILLLGIVVACAAAAAASAGDAELLVSAKSAAPLRAHVTYRASTFPLQLRVTPADGTWGGAQWRSTSHGKPAFGGALLARPPLDAPRGDVVIETAYGPTPSVTATIARLRTGGSGTTYEEPRPVRIAGYSGMQFDGEVWGKWGHPVIPFSPVTHGASPPDAMFLKKGEVFRLVALDVKGKTVVLLFENWKLPADQFPAFLDSAGRLLGSLRLG
ncbi:MAG TPA: hypothetical protein VGF23_04120 [Gaiellaceae bacterium]|jgi:hypothetical protein